MATKRNKAKTQVESPRDRRVPDQRTQNIAAWLEDLATCPNLNDWEDGFVTNIADKFTVLGELTDGQFDKLKEVWERHQR